MNRLLLTADRWAIGMGNIARKGFCDRVSLAGRARTVWEQAIAELSERAKHKHFSGQCVWVCPDK